MKHFTPGRIFQVTNASCNNLARIELTVRQKNTSSRFTGFQQIIHTGGKEVFKSYIMGAVPERKNLTQ